MRNFNDWFENFIPSISDYNYYIDFKKVINNVDRIKIELNILNSLIGSDNIEEEFLNIVRKYPETLKCIPILLAVRGSEILITTESDNLCFKFNSPNQTPELYCEFMRNTGLFSLIENKQITNLVDYVTGVETGLDSNGRKNRGGHLMENLVEKYLIKAGFTKDVSYFKEMYISEIEKRWQIDLSKISNIGKTEKRFDFVVSNNNHIYAIETNFYSSQGSKLNETARSYKNICLESKDIENFSFIWITDGAGWKSARHNLEETFDCLDNIYNINDLRNNLFERLFK